MTNRGSHADSREYQTQDAKQHVGLKNQGATCYMNSLLQQLFHIPDFRHSLLSLELEGGGAESPAAAAAAATAEDEGKDKAVLFELQSLFALLQTSEKKAADTLPFCRSLTDYTGEPLLLHEQKDVDEFATLLFDKLESLDPRMDGLLKGLFGGTLVNQVISHECPHRSEREEPFPMLKVDVKNKSSLEDSLELYVAGELLAGDNKYACRCVLLCPSSFFFLFFCAGVEATHVRQCEARTHVCDKHNPHAPQKNKQRVRHQGGGAAADGAAEAPARAHHPPQALRVRPGAHDQVQGTDQKTWGSKFVFACMCVACVEVMDGSS